MSNENLDAWQAELGKLRRQNNSHSLPAARKPAQLCESLEATLTESKSPLTPVAHLAALLALLHQLATSQSDDAEELTAAALYLLAIAAPHVPPAVYRAKADEMIRLLGGLLPVLLSAAEGAAALKSLLTTLQYTYGALQSKRLAKPDASQLFNTMLPLLTDPRPKVRRKVHELIWSAVFDEQSVEPHPYANRVGEHVVRTLTSSAKEARSLATKKDHNTQALAKFNETNTRLISLCAFIKGAARRWPTTIIVSLLAVILSLPRLQNPYLSRASFDILELLLDPQSGSSASVQTVTSALEGLLELRPPVNAAVVLPGWLAALETVMVAFARIDRTACSAVVMSHFEGCLSYCASAVESEEVRTRAEKAACGLVRFCIDEGQIEAALQVVARAMKDLRWKGKGLPHLLGITCAIVSRMRTIDRDRARTLLRPHVVYIGEIRTRSRFEYRQQADDVIAVAGEVCGPRWMFEILPLNLVNTEGKVSTEGRAWLLSVLRNHIVNTELHHFVTVLVPLCENLFNLRSDAVSRGKPSELEVKIYDTLVEQIWALLPGYCDLPIDLSTALTRQFVELLANVLYSQQSLRPFILRALQLLVEKNKALADSTAPADTLRASFGLDQAVSRSNLDLLASYAPNLLAVLFNIFGKTGSENGASILACIETYLQILNEQIFAETYKKVVGLFRQAIVAAGPTADKKISKVGADPPATHTMLDLLIVMAPLCHRRTASSLYNLLCEPNVLFNSDPTVQKKVYRALGKLTASKSGLVLDNLDDLIARLTQQQSPRVASAAKRYRTELVAHLIQMLPSDRLHVVSLLLPEAVLATKEANMHTREAGFDLLILMAQKMDEGGTVQRSLLVENDGQGMSEDAPASVEEFFTMVVAGLAGSTPHMIASTITALARLLFDFHDHLSPDSLSGLLATLNNFLRVATREVVRATLGFWKVAVVCLTAEQLETHLEDLVSGLLTWSSDHKNHFKLKVRHILERLIRKFGVERIEHEVPEDDRKFITNIRKSQQRAKRKKVAHRAEAEADEGLSSDDEAVKPRASGQSAFDDALYGSESEGESGEEGEEAVAAGSRAPAKRNEGNVYLKEDEDVPMDLLDAQVTARETSDPSRRRRSHVELDARGKLVLEGPTAKQKAADPATDATAAYIEAIEGEDGHRRDARGRVRFNKASDNKRGRGLDDEMDIEGAEDTNRGGGPRPAKRAKAGKISIGQEFKAKRAGGDVSKNGMSPYAYVPLNAVGGKKGARGKANLAFTNRKAGKSQGSRGARMPKRG